MAEGLDEGARTSSQMADNAEASGQQTAAKAEPSRQENAAQAMPSGQEDAAKTGASGQENAAKAEPSEEENAGKPPKYKKRKVALFFAYIGAGYQGMQRNPGAVTIEGELEQALFKAGAITKDNFGDPKKVHWMRSARTDKGVSAVGQVVSGKFIIEPPGFVERLNAHLPEKIRCLGCKRVTAGFDARTNCDRRKYEYVIPSFALDPDAYREREYYNLKAGRKEIEDARLVADGNSKGPESVAVSGGAVEDAPATPQAEGVPADQPVESQPGTPGAEVGKRGVGNGSVEEPPAKRPKLEAGSVDEQGNKAEVSAEVGNSDGQEKIDAEEDKQHSLEASLAGVEHFLETHAGDENTSNGEPKQPFKYTPAVQKRLNRLLAKYKGTHNFHNFTTRIKATDGQANRYIISFSAGPPFLIDGVEHVRLSVCGQSFMLHQIRKMVGLVLAVMRNVIAEDVIDFALRKDMDFLVPTAPELGLFLEESIFGAYNKRFGYDHEELSMKAFKDQVADFKQKYVYKHIAQAEKEEGIMATWLKTLNEKNYRDFAAANARAEEEEAVGLEDEA